MLGSCNYALLFGTLHQEVRQTCFPLGAAAGLMITNVTETLPQTQRVNVKVRQQMSLCLQGIFDHIRSHRSKRWEASPKAYHVAVLRIIKAGLLPELV